MIELGTLQNHAVTLNISYMFVEKGGPITAKIEQSSFRQVHPSLINEVLPLGVRGRERRRSVHAD